MNLVGAVARIIVGAVLGAVRVRAVVGVVVEAVVGLSLIHI